MIDVDIRYLVCPALRRLAGEAIDELTRIVKPTVDPDGTSRLWPPPSEHDYLRRVQKLRKDAVSEIVRRERMGVRR